MWKHRFCALCIRTPTLTRLSTEMRRYKSCAYPNHCDGRSDSSWSFRRSLRGSGRSRERSDCRARWLTSRAAAEHRHGWRSQASGDDEWWFHSTVPVRSSAADASPPHTTRTWRNSTRLQSAVLSVQLRNFGVQRDAKTRLLHDPGEVAATKFIMLNWVVKVPTTSSTKATDLQQLKLNCPFCATSSLAEQDRKLYTVRKQTLCVVTTSRTTKNAVKINTKACLTLNNRAHVNTRVLCHFSFQIADKMQSSQRGTANVRSVFR